MPTETYAEGVQIKEVRFDAREVIAVLLENLVSRASTPYDFDYERPMVIRDDNGEIAFRFAPKKITQTSDPSRIHFKPLRA